MATYPNYTAQTVGSEAWADTVRVYDTSASNDQSIEDAQKSLTVKELMGGAWASTYDAAGTQAITTSATKLVGGANWDGTFGPAAYNATITATTNDGITPTIGGLYDVRFECEAHTGAEGTATFTLRNAGAAVTGMSCAIQVSATAAEASIFVPVSMSATLSLTAGALYDIFAVGSGSLTLTYRNARFTIRRIGPAA